MRVRLFFLIAFFSFIFADSSVAQKYFKKGDIVLNGGIGLGTNLYTGGYWNLTFPPIILTGDYAIEQAGPGMIGIGGFMGFTGAKTRFYDPVKRDYYGINYNYSFLGGRGSYHVDAIEEFDLYGGIAVGLYIVRTTYYGSLKTSSIPKTGLAGGLFLGGKYYFQDNIGLFAELGYNISYLTIGVSFRF